MRVRHNALWNVFGQGLPLAVAVFFIPPLISGIGIERFGALTLVWAFLTYFSLFDLGIARAVTQMIAGNTQAEKKDESDLVWTAFILSFALGIVAALLLFFFAPFMVSRLLRLQGSLQHEMVWSLREMAVILPFLIHSLTLRGALEAKRRFDLSNLIRIPLGVFTYGAPLIVLAFSHDLSVIVAVLLGGRMIAWLVNFWLVLRVIPHLRRRPTWKPQKFRELLSFGGWVTISNIATPFTDNADRFLITAILSISMVAYYTTPLELVGKLAIISLGIGGAIFPEFAARFRRNPVEARQLYFRGMKYMLAALFPPVLIGSAYAYEGLSWWLNPEFARVGGPVVQWLALWALIGGFRLVPYYFLVGAGRPKIAAIYDVLELPVYAGIVYLLLKTYGVPGAAFACFLRVVLGGGTYHFFSSRMLGFSPSQHLRAVLPFAAAVALLLMFHLHLHPVVKALLTLGATALYLWLAWFYVLEKKDKAFILKRIGKAVP